MILPHLGMQKASRNMAPEWNSRSLFTLKNLRSLAQLDIAKAPFIDQGKGRQSLKNSQRLLD